MQEEAARKSDILAIEVKIHAKTERAVLVSETGEEKDAQWFPLSQVDLNYQDDGPLEIIMPEWLAIDKGFI